MVAGLAHTQSKTHEVCVALPLLKGMSSKLEFTGKKIPSFDPLSKANTLSSQILKDSFFLEAKFHNIRLYLWDSVLFRSTEQIYENPDEHYRFAMYSFAVFHLGLTLKVDLVHAHDWHTALVNVLNSFSSFPKKNLLTIHNLAYQGEHPYEMCGFLREEPFFLNIDFFLHKSKVNYLKAGLTYANFISTVSPSYRNEILNEPEGQSLSGVLWNRRLQFFGILNGIDSEEWNPSTDDKIFQTYNLKTIKKGKEKNKAELYKLIARKIDTKRPLVGVIGRLTHQKGYETFVSYLGKNANPDFFYVVLGAGDAHLEKSFFYYSDVLQDRVYFYKGYSEELAHKITAASDFFLMPSLFEPCGLNQMYSQTYGTIPIVSRVGGLRDTVEESNLEEYYTGIVFEPGDLGSMDYAMGRAKTLFEDGKKFTKARSNIMKLEYSWDKRVSEYETLYKNILEGQKFI